MNISDLIKVGIRPVDIAKICKCSMPNVWKWNHLSGIPQKYHKRLKRAVINRSKNCQTFIKTNK